MANYDNMVVEIAFSGDPDALAPLWVDVTPWVDTIAMPLEWQRGASAEATDDTSGITFTFRNPWQFLTPGNALAPDTALKSSMMIRLSEVVGDMTFRQYTGYIEFPEIASWVDSSATSPVDQTITVTAVDLEARLARDELFVSTLGAHILGSRSAEFLAAYYPLCDAPTMVAAAGTGTKLVQKTYGTAVMSLVSAGGLWATSTAGPPGDDIGSLQLMATTLMGVEFDGTISVAATTGQKVVMSAWIRRSNVADVSAPLAVQSAFCDMSFGQDGSAQVDAPGGSSATPTFGVVLPCDVWRLVTVSLTLTTGLVEYWCGTDLVATATMSAPIPTTFTLDTIRVGGGGSYAGYISHAQLYVGYDPFTYSDHLAQVAVGMYGLERQTTGARIRTILQYAGVNSSAVLARIETGGSLMQRATLAGQTPLEAIADAVRTERGLLYIDGDGHVVFKDRRTLYNI